jgi:hypothetical protein
MTTWPLQHLMVELSHGISCRRASNMTLAPKWSRAHLLELTLDLAEAIDVAGPSAS